MSNKDMLYIKKLNAEYGKKEVSKLEQLKKLDKHVKLPITVFAYIFGSVCSLILGFGMCLAMEVIFPNNMIYGIIIGVMGILLCIINYFIYKKILISRKRKYSNRILELTDELLKK